MKYAYIIFLVFFLVFILEIEAEKEKVIHAVKTDVSPVIDGKLDEQCWQKASKISDFVQSEPEEGKKASEKTIVYLLYDEKKLYVGFECWQSDIKKLQASATRRDSHFFNDDYVELFLDTFHDKRNCYSFALNLLGTQNDARIANEGSNQHGHGGDNSWDCGWEGQSDRSEDKWTAEFAIPFCELRFENKPNSVWGINFMRNIESLEEEDSWSKIGRERFKVSKYGTLVDLPVSELVTTRPLELKPYVTVKPQKTSEWNVFEKERGDIGLDIRYPFSKITLDMTLNPDFAQVEADPSRINLSDMPMRVPEKRPFFQEGNELFRTPIEIFYTRKIESPIVGIKAAGKIGNYNLAILDTQTDKKVTEDEVEEMDLYSNNFLVFRLERDVGKRSSVGFLGVNRQNKDSYNRAAGIDSQIAFNDFKLSGQYAYTHSPDIGTDSDAFLTRFSGDMKEFFVMFSYRDIGADFEAKSGFVPDSRIDRKGGMAILHYRKEFKNTFFKEIGTGLDYERLYNHDKKLTNERRGLDFNIRFGDFFTRAGFESYYHPVEEDDKTNYYTDRTFGMFGGWFPSKWISLFTRMQIGKRDGKDSLFIGPSINFKPIDELGLEFEYQRSEHGDELTIINRFIVDYRFSQKMNIRTTYEFTNDNKRYAFILYSWEFRPESNLFLVYTQNKEPDNYTEHTFFMKIAYLFKWMPFCKEGDRINM